ncbi:MAG TPA: ECF-type sigma factor [Gemmataceae bacterium]|nr:ECF-type sigma factor [Gemmataceae bacterium]
MTEVTRILSAIEQGDPHAAEQLLPLVYDELRRLAAEKLAREKPGQTLDATALVHEAYLRLVGPADGDRWRDRGHFFAAAAEAMSRILIEQARRKRAEKRGGGGRRFELSEADRVALPNPDTLLTVDEVLEQLAREVPESASIARLRLFAGLSIEEAAAALGISRPTAFRDWAYARACLTTALSADKKNANL